MGLRSALVNLMTPQPMAAGWAGYQEYLRLTGGGATYPLGLQQTLVGPNESYVGDFTGIASGGYAGNGIVFAVENARLNLFSQARFMYRELRSGTPGELWSGPELDILRTPWPNGTTSDLLNRMLQAADIAGDSFVARRVGRLAMLRPDWTVVVHGSPNLNDDVEAWDPDARVMGYGYMPGGPGHEMMVMLPETVAHFVPTSDPLSPSRGLSWMAALQREIEADTAATTHKGMYFKNAGTPNMIVTNVPGATPEAFDGWVKRFSKGHDGVRNAYRTLYFSGATDAKVVGNDLAQMDFKLVQGAGEVRIANAAGVPATVVGLSEGLAGSSLNAGNFASAMRRFADLTGRPLWQNACGSLASIIDVQYGSELWYDDRYIPALKDDIKDAAEVQAKQAQAMRQYVDAGFEPDSVVDAINAGDLKRLKHTGLYSVQLQPPMPDGPPKPPPEPTREPSPGESAMTMAAAALTDTASALRAQLARPAPAPEMPDIIFGRGMFEGAVPVTVTAPDIHVTTPPVTIERGAVEISAPVTVTTPDVHVTTPDVHVTLPDIHVAAPEVTVTTPDVHVTTPATVIDEGAIQVHVTTPEQRATTKRVIREGGQITRIIEEPTDG